MVTCKDCLHNHVCALWRAQEEQDAKSWSDSDDWDCDYFDDKSRFVELPCKVGDVVYSVITAFNVPIESKIYEICFRSGILAFRAARKGYFGIAFTENDIGKTVFFDCREAEAALAERRNE